MRKYRFALPEKKMVIGLPIGSHITIAAKDVEGKDVMRPYTPVTDDNSKGHVDFVIKASCSTARPTRLKAMTLCASALRGPPGPPVSMWRILQVYPQGKMSQCMERLAIGDTLKFKGPRGKFKYSRT